MYKLSFFLFSVTFVATVSGESLVTTNRPVSVQSDSYLEQMEYKKNRFFLHQLDLFQEFAEALAPEVSCYKLTLMEPFYGKCSSGRSQNAAPQKISDELQRILDDQNCVDDELAKLLHRRWRLGCDEFLERLRLLKQCGYDVEGLKKDLLYRDFLSLSSPISSALQDQVNAAVKLTKEEEMRNKSWSERWFEAIRTESLKTSQKPEASGLEGEPDAALKTERENKEQATITGSE